MFLSKYNAHVRYSVAGPCSNVRVSSGVEITNTHTHTYTHTQPARNNSRVLCALLLSLGWSFNRNIPHAPLGVEIMIKVPQSQSFYL